MSTTDWRQYQEATARLFRKLGCEAEVEFPAEGARAKHKVDVHVRFVQSGIPCTWVIECKLWKSRIPKEKVMALKSIVEDTGADRGIIFCEKGFQPAAVDAARGTNITLVTSIRDFAKAAMASRRGLMAAEDVAGIFATFAEEIDDLVEGQISASTEIGAVKVKQIISARRGQGIFRAHVLSLEPCCRLTGIANPRLLLVAHLKPWRACTDRERLDGNNGLTFTPSADFLFDRGLISFEDNGDLLVSPFVTQDEISRLGFNARVHKTGHPFLAQQHKYLDYHRRSVFLAD